MSVISIRNKFKRQKSLFHSFPLQLSRSKKLPDPCEPRGRTHRTRDGTREKNEPVERAAYTESRVRSFARSPARSMMLSLHNLRGTVTGSRERMAVPAS